MADPLFIADMATLKAELRLTGVDSTTDAHAIVDAAVREVRAGFYLRLGVARVATLVALASAAEPDDADEVLRSIAELCESIWVRAILVDRLPTQFMDGGSGAQEFLNQEGIFRSMPQSQREAQRQRLMNQVEEYLDILAGDVAIGDGPPVQIHTQSDQTPRVYPAGSLIEDNARLFGDPTREIPDEEDE